VAAAARISDEPGESAEHGNPPDDLSYAINASDVQYGRSVRPLTAVPGYVRP
jgi:hypothetical protein